MQDFSKKSGGVHWAIAADVQSDVTTALEAVRAGNPSAKERLIELIYDDLRSAAGRLMRGERVDHTLQATALVNESLVRLLQTSALNQIDDRSHLLAAATIAFKRILIDHARARATQKRGGGRGREPLTETLDQVAAPSVTPPLSGGTEAGGDSGGPSPFDAILAGYEERGLDVLALDAALDEMREIEPRWFEIVLLRFFGGFTLDRVAELMDVSRRTVAQDWNHARAWLRVRVGEEYGREPGAAAPDEGAVPGGEPLEGG